MSKDDKRTTEEILVANGFDPRSDASASRQAEAALYVSTYPLRATRNLLIITESFVGHRFPSPGPISEGSANHELFDESVPKPQQ